MECVLQSETVRGCPSEQLCDETYYQDEKRTCGQPQEVGQQIREIELVSGREHVSDFLSETEAETEEDSPCDARPEGTMEKNHEIISEQHTYCGGYEVIDMILTYFH